MSKPLVNKMYTLQKFPGKGGWTFAMIPEIPPDKKSPFGWVRVKGSIDDYSFQDYRLMPMGNGFLFLPVKASVRKKIGKEAGDVVNVILYRDEDALMVPDELLLCLEDEPQAFAKFFALSENIQREYIQWILSAQKEQTKVLRISSVLDLVLQGKRVLK